MRDRQRSLYVRLGILGCALLAAELGCSSLLGLDEFTDQAPAGGAGTATSSGGGTGAGGAPGGTGGSAGTGGGNPVCRQGDSMKCPYSGPALTEDVGLCHAGTATCLLDGSGFGPCSGEVLPAPEDCSAGADENCDGSVNEGCPCAPNTTQACYGGPAGSDVLGACHAGLQTCNPQGTTWGDCIGEQTPLAEDCATQDDENCDGQINEMASGCLCAAGMATLVDCYTGAVDTQNVGTCHDGTWTCDAAGTGYAVCVGEKLPAASEDCTKKGDEDCDALACSDCVWSQLFSAANTQISNGVAVDLLGNSVVVGSFQGSIELAGTTFSELGLGDIFVAKLDPAGTLVWAQQFGDVASQSAYAVAVDASNNVIFTGRNEGTVSFGGQNLGPGAFVVKLSAAGAHVWSKNLGGIADQSQGQAIAVDGSNNVMVTGEFQGTLTYPTSLTSAGGNDLFVVKLSSASGTGLWNKRFGDASSQYAGGVAVDASGNVLVNGYFGGVIDFTANAQQPLTSAGSNDIFLAKLDSSGAHLWSKRFGDASAQSSKGISLDSLGGPVITGNFSGSVDFGGGSLTSAGGSDVFVAKYSQGGLHQWSKSFGDVSTNQKGERVRVDASSDIIIAGNFYGTLDFGGGALTSASLYDIFLVKLTSGGTHLWSKRFGSGANQLSEDLAISPISSRISLVGEVSGSVDFGTGAMSAGDNYDAFLAVFEP